MYQYKIKEIIEVRDGDTIVALIDLGFSIFVEKTVRLCNIDSPETRTRDHLEKSYGLRAKERLKEYIESSESLIIATLKPDAKEKYGRVLGELYGEGQNLTASEMLLAENLVWYYDGGGKVKDLTKLAPLTEMCYID